MKRSNKAVLLSALVFPGVGHLYLKRFVIGLLLSGGAATVTYFIVSNIVNKALDIVERIQSEKLSVDVNAISLFVSEQFRSAENSHLSIVTIALIVFWIIGIVDSYRIGRIEEMASE